jgi:hypothetical protein
MTLPRGIHTLLLVCAYTAHSQVLIPREHLAQPVNMFPSDTAILNSHHPRTDFSCAVKPVAPRLDFDLKFHAGYAVSISLRDFVGSGNRLKAIFRVVPKDRPEEPAYFSQDWIVPAVDEHSRGTAELEGSFVLGEGEYQVEWLLRDRLERVCSAHWRLAISPRGKDKQVRLSLAPGIVEADASDPYVEGAPVRRDGSPRKLLVLFHAAPQASSAVTIHKRETLALLAILRQIAQEPGVGTYSMIAFNLGQRSVLYRAQNTSQIDFPTLGAALKQLQLGTIDARKLRGGDSAPEFLDSLIKEELANSRPDALVFVGPRLFDSAAISHSVKDSGEPKIPVFYLNYTPDPAANPWRDLIGNLVHLWKGAEYTISRPPDLSLAWSEVMSRITHKTSSGTAHASFAVTDPLPQK